MPLAGLRIKVYYSVPERRGAIVTGKVCDNPPPFWHHGDREDTEASVYDDINIAVFTRHGQERNSADGLVEGLPS